MDLKSAIIKTRVAESGMLVRDAFRECGQVHVQALPFRDAQGKISGRITLKNIMKFSCLPEYMVELAHLLGSQMSCVDNAEAKAREVLGMTVDAYVREVHETIPSDTPLIKALAVMEQHDTSYVFVVDDDVYRGIVTIQGIAHAMSHSEED